MTLGMKVRAVAERNEFVSRNLNVWLATEAESGALMRLRNARAIQDEVFLEIVGNDGQILQTAYVNPNDQIVFSRVDRETLQKLAGFLHDNRIKFPGIFAPHPSSNEFVEAYSAVSGKKFRTVKQMVHMKLDEVCKGRVISGSLRKAERRDREAIAKFRDAAQAEGNTFRPFDSLKSVNRDLEAGSLYLWEDANGKIVSTAAIFLDRSPATGYVDHVFTSYDSRKQGFGSSIVGELSRKIQRLNRIVRLSVDATNVGAISVYKALGFSEECRMDNLRLQQ